MLLDTARMEFAYDRSFGTEMQLEPYARLLHDAMTGDRTLFNSSEGIERLWEISESLRRNPLPVGLYEPGTWGPPEADQLIAPRHWHASEHA
jgi:glucose-6-phosphate 1-dehydrogenase